MKKFTISLVVACTLCVAAAVAQMAPGGSGQGTQQSSPSMNSPRGQQPGMAQPGNDTTGQTTQTEQTGNTASHEKKLKGCVQSQGGQYVLETKKGKAIALTGQDVSAHVGHEVAVKGMWEKGGSSSMSSTAAGSSGSSTSATNEKTFNVASVDMISDTCGAKTTKEKSNSGGMGTGTTGNSPTTGSGTGSSGSTGTGQPPQ
jgi:TolA-binding protein